MSQDDYMDAGGTITGSNRVKTSGTSFPEQLRTNIGHIRLKMSGANFPDKVEDMESGVTSI